MTQDGRALSPVDRRRAESLSVAALLVALSAIAPLAVDMFLPSMPTMADEFGTPESTLQLAVTLFLLAFAASQLIYGPLSDRYGRRPVLAGGLVLFVVGGLIALYAQSAPMLIAGRIAQGLGGGVGPAIASATVLDIYGRERSARVLALMTIATPLAPAIAPVIGGILHDTFQWRAVFVVLAAAGVVLLALHRTMVPETNLDRDREALTPGRLASNGWSLLSHPQFLAYSMVMGLMFSGQLVFISSSSFVLIDELGLSSLAFGLSFGLIALGIMAGASISSRLVNQLPLGLVVLSGSAIAALASIAMAGLVTSDIGVWGVVAPMFVVALGFGIGRPPAMAGALIPFRHIAGYASAVVGFSTMAIATAYNIVFSTLIDVSSEAMATGIAIAAVSSLVAVLALRPWARDLPEAAPATANG